MLPLLQIRSLTRLSLAAAFVAAIPTVPAVAVEEGVAPSSQSTVAVSLPPSRAEISAAISALEADFGRIESWGRRSDQGRINLVVPISGPLSSLLGRQLLSGVANAAGATATKFVINNALNALGLDIGSDADIINALDTIQLSLAAMDAKLDVILQQLQAVLTEQKWQSFEAANREVDSRSALILAQGLLLESWAEVNYTPTPTQIENMETVIFGALAQMESALNNTFSGAIVQLAEVAGDYNEGFSRQISYWNDLDDYRDYYRSVCSQALVNLQVLNEYDDSGTVDATLLAAATIAVRTTETMYTMVGVGFAQWGEPPVSGSSLTAPRSGVILNRPGSSLGFAEVQLIADGEALGGRPPLPGEDWMIPETKDEILQYMGIIADDLKLIDYGNSASSWLLGQGISSSYLTPPYSFGGPSDLYLCMFIRHTAVIEANGQCTRPRPENEMDGVPTYESGLPAPRLTVLSGDTNLGNRLANFNDDAVRGAAFGIDDFVVTHDASTITLAMSGQHDRYLRFVDADTHDTVATVSGADGNQSIDISHLAHGERTIVIESGYQVPEDFVAVATNGLSLDTQTVTVINLIVEEGVAVHRGANCHRNPSCQTNVGYGHGGGNRESRRSWMVERGWVEKRGKIRRSVEVLRGPFAPNPPEKVRIRRH